MNNLFIAVPTLDYVHYRFMECLVNLTDYLSDMRIPHHVEIRGGTLIYLARDWLVRKAAQNGYSHMLWLDADMVFDVDIVEKLSAVGKPIVSAVCRSRHKGMNTTLYETLKPNKKYLDYPDGEFRIEGCGFACVLAETKAMARVMDNTGTCFLPTLDYGEDLAFCERAKKHNIVMAATSDAVIGHIGQAIVMPNQEIELI